MAQYGLPKKKRQSGGRPVRTNLYRLAGVAKQPTCSFWGPGTPVSPDAFPNWSTWRASPTAPTMVGDSAPLREQERIATLAQKSMEKASLHAELPCLGRGTRNRQHACPPLFRPTYTNREPVFWTTRRINDKHFARVTSHEPRVLWRAPLDTGVGALNNSLSKANCMASWNPAMSDAFCTSTA